MKKKFLGVLLVLVMAVVLAACGEVPTILVSFETNGGSDVEPITINEESVANFTLPANPTKEGYDFVGWYLDEDLNTVYETINFGDGNITLYAKWQAQKTQAEINQEDLVGSWATTGATASFNSDNTCSVTIPTGEYDGTYTVDGEGKVVITASLKGFPITLNGTINDGTFSLNILTQSFAFEKVPEFDFNLIDLPDFSTLNGIDFETKINGSFLLNIAILDKEATAAAQAELSEGQTADPIYNNITIEVKVNYNVKVQVEKLIVADVKDIKAYVELKGTIEPLANGQAVLDEEAASQLKAFEDIKAYVYNGVIYANVNLPKKEVTEQTTETGVYEIVRYYNEETLVSIDLEELYNFIVNEIKDEYEVEDIIENLPLDIEDGKAINLEEVVNELNKAVKMLLTQAYSMGVNTEGINKVIDLIKGFKPVVTEGDNAVTYAYVKENIVDAITALKDFVVANKNIVIIIGTAISEELMTEQDYTEMVNGITEAIDSIKNYVKLDACKVELAKDAEGKINGINSDLDVTIYFTEDQRSYLTIKLTTETVINGTEVSITFPDFTGAIDMTDELIDDLD